MDGKVKEEDKVINNDDLISYVFQNILNQKDLDIRDKRSAIIDFIAAGIETVSIFKPLNTISTTPLFSNTLLE